MFCTKTFVAVLTLCICFLFHYYLSSNSEISSTERTLLSDIENESEDASFTQCKGDFLQKYIDYGYDGRIDQIFMSEYSRLKENKIVYLDHSANTLYAKSQIEWFRDDLLRNVYGNPHSINPASLNSHFAIRDVRNAILKHFNVSSKSYAVIFTANASAALKLVGESFPFSPLSKLLLLAQNHVSALGIREYAFVAESDVAILSEEQVESALEEPVHAPSLFVFPAQCNFSGRRYPLHWVQKNTHSNRFILIDAAAFATTKQLDLKKFPADFVAISLYKIFGFPTGLGALIVKNTSAVTSILQKKFIGGGTVAMISYLDHVHEFHTDVSARFEDGTLPFLDIVAAKGSFEFFRKTFGSFNKISLHTASISDFLYNELRQLRHFNGVGVVRFYSGGETSYLDISRQGPIINFNLINCSGAFIGYAHVQQVALENGISLRAGTFCNPGASMISFCQSTSDILNNFKAGHVCSSKMDIIDGHVTGSLRVSFGAMSRFEDAYKFMSFIKNNFVEASEKLIIK